jgi:hypothetical protein
LPSNKIDTKRGRQKGHCDHTRFGMGSGLDCLANRKLAKENVI